LSAVTQAARVLGLSDSLVQHAMAFFEAATTRPAGVLRLGSPEMPFTDVGRERTLEGLKNESTPHGLLVVTGDMQYENVAHRMDDSEFVAQRRLATQEVARAFRIPPSMIGAGSGGDSLTYSTVEQQSLDFVRYSLTPWLRRIELAISNDRDLAFAKQYVKFETGALLRPDSAGRSAFYTAALDPVTGWLTRDEVRRLEDLPPEQGPPPITAALNAMTTNVTQGVATNGNG
jgi:HK97 family phage portal protein